MRLPSVYQIVLILGSYGVNSYPDLYKGDAKRDSGLLAGKQMLTVSSGGEATRGTLKGFI